MDETGRSDPRRGETAHPEPVRRVLDADRIMTVWFDAPGRSVNTLTAATWDGLDAAVRAIETLQPAGVVFASAKARSFIAGADLFELQAMADAELDRHLARGQRILDRIAALPMPTVAAINGDALGGGLEVALACRFRVAADDGRAKLGLPETTLGLVPGWGGTIRLPRLVGIEPALTLMLPGKSISPREAAALGLVDSVVPRERLDAEARSLAAAPPRATTGCLEADPAARRDLFARFRHETRGRWGDHLPAALRLIDIVETGCDDGHVAAEAAERRGLVELRRTPAGRNLMRLFFLRTAARKAAAAEVGGSPMPVRRAVVIGGGTMGAGIAAALSAAGVPTSIVEADERAAAVAAIRVAETHAGGTVPVSTGWAAVNEADLVVEAVVEDLAAKLEIFRRLDGATRPDAVLASNTSSLGLGALAAAVRDPGRVIGLHFFNPVARMPLVEVVRAPQTAADALATGVAVAGSLGKIPVVCRDGPGFVVNRVLFPYLRAALLLASEGADVREIDEAVRAWGMPMGPCALMDEIGLDVTACIFRSLERALGPRLSPPPLLATAVGKGWFGRKSGRGFYDYPPDRRPVPNPEWGAVHDAAARQPVPVRGVLVEPRLIGPMVDECRRLLDERIVASADAIDLATVLGIGFPAFRGGLATFAGLSRGA